MLDNELTERLQLAEVGELLAELIRATTRGDRASGRRCLYRLLIHIRKVKGEKDASVRRTRCEEWAGNVSVCRTSWEGGKRKLGRLAVVILSAPPLSRHMRISAGPSEPQRGRSQGQYREPS